MSFRPNTRRRIDESVESGPLGGSIIVVLSVFLFLMYSLLGLFQFLTLPLLLSASLLLGVAHLGVAYGLARAKPWGWKLGAVVYGLDAGVTFHSSGPTNLPAILVFVVIVTYLIAVRRDLSAKRNEITRRAR